MKYRALILFSAPFLILVLILAFCGGNKTSKAAPTEAEKPAEVAQADILTAEDSDLDAAYRKADERLAEISRQLTQPNILKEDILRGWYLGGKDERKFGTPDTWIFKENGKDSKWISPNSLEEEDQLDDYQLCRATAGTYISSCLQTSAPDCEYVDKSYCECVFGSKWMDGQGCILTTDRGRFVSINSSELEQGWYLGLPNEKKLNTPGDWIWVEQGKESKWSKS